MIPQQIPANDSKNQQTKKVSLPSNVKTENPFDAAQKKFNEIFNRENVDNAENHLLNMKGIFNKAKEDAGQLPKKKQDAINLQMQLVLLALNNYQRALENNQLIYPAQLDLENNIDKFQDIGFCTPRTSDKIFLPAIATYLGAMIGADYYFLLFGNNINKILIAPFIGSLITFALIGFTATLLYLNSLGDNHNSADGLAFKREAKRLKKYINKHNKTLAEQISTNANISTENIADDKSNEHAHLMLNLAKSFKNCEQQLNEIFKQEDDESLGNHLQNMKAAINVAKNDNQISEYALSEINLQMQIILLALENYQRALKTNHLVDATQIDLQSKIKNLLEIGYFHQVVGLKKTAAGDCAFNIPQDKKMNCQIKHINIQSLCKKLDALKKKSKYNTKSHILQQHKAKKILQHKKQQPTK